MLKSISLLMVKVIDKILSLKKRIVIIKPGNQKNALISYVLVPAFNLPFYFKTSHNNKFQCYLIIQYLKSKGYNVYVYDYLNENIDLSISYDLFIGHNKTFSTLAKKIKGNFKSILLATGSSPKFGNEQQKNRILDVNRRKLSTLKVFDDNIVPDFTDNYEHADLILLLGNQFVKETYEERFWHKIKLINNVTLHPYFQRNTTHRNNNFLFISSIGQVHRGLDLLLDAFDGMTNKLYVVSAFRSEAEFVSLYYNQLYETSNIIAKGYLNLNSKEFKSILNDVDYVILPSCAEGQSSSIINMITYGLIPVVPDNVGVSEIEQIGIKIELIDLDGVKRAIKLAINMDINVFRSKKISIQMHSSIYTETAFIKSLDHILN